MQAIKIIPAFLAIICMLCVPAFADDCPTVTLPEKLQEDDRASLEELDRRFASYTVDIDFLTERNSLLKTHVFADQQLVIDSFYARYCNLLNESKWYLPALERQARLHYAKVKLYQRVIFPSVILDSRSASPDQAPAAGVAHRYLRDTPYQVTDGNKFFVIVSSVKTFVAVINEMRRLKQKAPQFDFVAHGPYDDNPYYGIKIATWARRSVAREALAKARKYVSKHSYLWTCAGEGDRC